MENGSIELKDLIKEDFQLLIDKGNIAFYNSAEITNIYLTQESENPINIFTLVVFEEKECSFNGENRKNLTDNLISIDNRSLGISQLRINLEDSETLFNNLMNDTGIWELNPGSLQVDELKIIPKQFIPAFEDVPLNNILKNNNENGSYIIEFFSEEKCLLTSLNEKLSENNYKKVCQNIMNYLSIDLLFLKDRMCNVIFQFPISLLSVKTKALDDENGIELKCGWHPLLEDLPDVELSTYTVLDKNIASSITSDILDGEIKSGNIRGKNLEIIRDKQKDLILWYSEGYYNRRIVIDGGINDPEPRIIEIDNENYKIPIKSHEGVRVGNFNSDYVDYITDRSYEESTKKLIENKEFLQYGINGADDRERALEDLRYIIKKNCKNGVYIWDPYADSQDILTTAYFCEYSNKVIRVINSCSNKIIKRRSDFEKELSNQKLDLRKLVGLIVHHFHNLFSSNKNKKQDRFKKWKQEQIDILNSSSNNRGINLEIRCQRGIHGWKFHDRFIIFPLEKPKVWSLGTSINTIGKDHSILMSVSNPKNVLDAFNDLWDDLEDSILWKYPEE